ncbi:MAG: phage tail protein I [Duganella sp.]
MDSLLPPNATPLERRLAAVGAVINDIPVPTRAVWDPDTCPVELLPFLASEFSVDRWDSTWSEKTKRAVIKAAYFVHKQKGTIGALRRVVEPLGYLINVLEWWETNPPGPRGTFRLDIGVLESGITEEMYTELERLIDDAKPLTRHLVGMAISVETRGTAYMAAASYLGDELTVYPYTPTLTSTAGRWGTAAAVHVIDTLTVHPKH